MNVCCIEDFRDQFEKLIKKNSYRDLCATIIEHFFDKTPEQLCSGTRLNGHSEVPFIKKRLKGRGWFRVYFLLLIKDDSVYLMYVHPKTGSAGAENISDKHKARLYQKVYDCLENKEYYLMSRNANGTEIIFSDVKEAVKIS